MDFVQYGLIPEFVGRFPVAVPLRSLSELELRRVMLGPKHAVGRQFQKLVHGCGGAELEFTPGACRELARAALRRETGARGLRALVERALADALFVLPEYDDVAKVVVDAEGVRRALAPRRRTRADEDDAEEDAAAEPSDPSRRARVVGGARLVFRGDEDERERTRGREAADSSPPREERTGLRRGDDGRGRRTTRRRRERFLFFFFSFNISEGACAVARSRCGVYPVASGIHVITRYRRTNRKRPRARFGTSGERRLITRSRACSCPEKGTSFSRRARAPTSPRRRRSSP